MQDLLGKYIEQKRHEKGLSVNELGKLSGIPAISISRYERGIHFPKEEKLEQILTTLELNKKQKQYAFFLLDISPTPDRFKKMLFELMGVENIDVLEKTYYLKNDLEPKKVDELSTDELLNIVIKRRLLDAAESGDLEDVTNYFRKMEEKIGDEIHNKID